MLTGHFPDQDVGENSIFQLDLPQNLLLTLPSQLVEQRPDVREYESLLHQASAGIGVATANMLPQFTISGALGTFAGAGMNPGALAFSLLAGVAQPTFEGGTLLHRRRAAIAAYDQALAQYRYTVLVAFQNLADSLRALQSDADYVRHRQPRSAPLRRVTALHASSIRRATLRIRHCWRRKMPISRHYSLWCRPRPAAMWTQRRFFKPLAEVGGIARMLSRRIPPIRRPSKQTRQ
jgi:Outer membrane efflux protein